MKPQQLTVLIALLTIGALVTAVFVKPKRGLDIQGGARVVLQADTTQLPAGQKWDANNRAAVIHTIENRVNANGVAEPVITPKGTDQFVVEIPAVRNEKEVLEQLQNTAQLQFFYSPDWRTNHNRLGKYEIQAEKDDAGNREQYTITDTATNKTFRDLFHINQALRALLDKGTADKAAVDSPLLPPLSDLSAAGGAGTVKIAPGDSKALEDLRDEARSFNTFLASSRRELDGSDILPNTRASFDTGGRSGGAGGGAIIELEFNAQGTEKFANFTRDHTNEVLMIYLDGRILTAPNINEPILNGKAQISGFPTLQEAKRTADFLNGGALPVPLKIVQQQSVEATLGNQAVTQGFIAGGIALLLVAVFMIGYYLLPGTVAVGALLLYTLFTYAIFLLIPVTFTLPGIAGFILSVGMAVDANILIFERTKEELRAGKPLKQAVPTGFGRAFSAIFDSNMCTAVTSLLLYYFGTGPVRGFALTLLIGVAVSMFTAITVTRSALLLLISNNPNQSLTSWGVNRQINPRLNVVGRRSFWYGLSLLVIVPGIVFAMLGGFKQGIDFTGGSELTLRFNQPHRREEIEKAVKDLGIEDPAAQIAGDNTVLVRLPKQKGADVTASQADQITAGLQKAFPSDNVTRQGFDFIGSSISQELTRNAFTSVILSSVFIVLYLAFRFAIGGFVSGLKFGVSAIIAMLHDVLVLIGLFSFLGFLLNWKVDSLFVTAALTVIGFSVHDTIVIFDRMRENLRLHSSGVDFENVVNNSINETFARSIFTSLTVVMTLLALLIFGGPVIRPLNAALLIGIISGTYSSIFNAAPLVVDWQKRFGGKLSAATGSRPSVTARPTTPASANGPSAPKGDDRPAFPRAPGAGNARAYTNGSANGTDGSQPTAGDENRPSLPPGPPRPRKRRM